MDFEKKSNFIEITEQLGSPLILLDRKKIKANLRHSTIQLDILEKTDSTNEYLKKFISQNEKIRVCIAELQTQGRGRLNRQWYSPFGQNIYFSMLYPFQKVLSELSGLSLVVGLAICQAIESVVKLKNKMLSIKWPNDIFVDQCKLAGVLIEIQAESNGFCQAIVGIGINVNMLSATKKDIGQPWTSLLKITEQYQDRNDLCVALIDVLMDYLERFSSHGLLAFTEEWKSRDGLFGRAVSVILGSKKHEGICVGINTQGHLLLETSEKIIQACTSGDSTLLK